MRNSAASEVGGVDERRSCRVQFRHEGVETPAWTRLQGIRSRKVRGKSVPRHVGLAGGVYGDALDLVEAAAAQVSGVGEPRPAGIQLDHIGVAVASGAWL